MQQKKLTHNYRNILPVILLGIFSFSVNYHYGFIGIMPMDNTVLYNGGYRVLKGYVPFTDYWLVTGPLLDYLNAFFFKILGVTWKTFIIHSSFFNLLISIVSYYLFIKIGQSKKFSIFYSALISILFYPVVGTPFVDHHSTFFLIMVFYAFILGVKKKNYFYFKVIPITFCFSFLSKQTPAAYGLIIILPLILLLCLSNKNNLREILLSFIIGSVGAIVFLILFFFLTNISIENFINQYILYAGSIGDYRISNYKFNFLDLIFNFKFINILILILAIISIKLILKEHRLTKDILIILTFIALSLVLIFHQFYTLNQNYIFFIIPILSCVIHVFYKKVFKKNYLLIFVFLLCIFSVSKYHLRFNDHRAFNELAGVDLSKAVDAETLSKDLKGLKWITHKNPNNPQGEISNLKEIIEILSKEKSKKILITEYQILAPILKIYDYSPNQWHHPSVSFPLRESQYFKIYKDYFIKNIKKNDIAFIFETKKDENTITGHILSENCFEKKRLSKLLLSLKLNKNCEDFR